jgi:hypothetical protein
MESQEMPKKALKMKVTERALIQRINRKLVHKGETLHIARGERWYSDLGYYYITSNNNLVAGHIKLDELGRELRVLKAYEEVADGKLK